jgi:valyl-tRNA synthetase
MFDMASKQARSLFADGTYGPPFVQALSLPEKWVMSRLAKTVKECEAGLEAIELGTCTLALVRFTWFELCDVFLEAVKIAAKVRAFVIGWCLKRLLVLTQFSGDFEPGTRCKSFILTYHYHLNNS